jgi:G:T-mismatch repair DNA endonuclease (very short patch repair protein)
MGDNLIDGMDDKNKTIYEFHGCFYHGCTKCFDGGSWNKLKSETFSTTYSKHLNRQKKIQQFAVNENMKLIEMWECDFDLMCKSNKKLNQQINNNSIQLRLNPRNALFGGRTNAFVLYYKITNNENICRFL